jgi:hypothetical protein
VADFTEGLQRHVPEIAKGLPQPVTSADVVSVDVGDSESVAMIRYSGDHPVALAGPGRARRDCAR